MDNLFSVKPEQGALLDQGTGGLAKSGSRRWRQGSVWNLLPLKGELPCLVARKLTGEVHVLRQAAFVLFLLILLEWSAPPHFFTPSSEFATRKLAANSDSEQSG